jgi:hypothetical protein
MHEKVLNNAQKRPIYAYFWPFLALLVGIQMDFRCFSHGLQGRLF